MKNLDPNQPKSKSERDPRQKYQNYAQLVQGVCQVDDPRLTPTERLFLNCLAAHNVKTNPHPGNKILMRACGIASRQGLNKIERRLLEKQLIEIVEPGGGRNHATVYRLRVEDARYPWPNKPATLELPFPQKKPATEELPVSENKPATEEPETRNSQPGNPQLDASKPATLELHPNLDSGYIPNTNTNHHHPAVAGSSESNKPDDDDVLYEKLCQRLPRFLEWLRCIVLDRAAGLNKRIVSASRYVKAALPSLLQEDLRAEMETTILRDASTILFRSLNAGGELQLLNRGVLGAAVDCAVALHQFSLAYPRNAAVQETFDRAERTLLQELLSHGFQTLGPDFQPQPDGWYLGRQPTKIPV